MPLTSDRMDALRRFSAAALADEHLSIAPASADASMRSYWRVTATHRMAAPAAAMRSSPTSGSIAAAGAPAYIVMDAASAKEDIAPWLDIDARLHRAGLHAPQVLAVDRGQGFVLMEDLGARTYLSELSDTTADALYADALDALLRMQTEADVAGLPAYDRDRLIAEMELLPEWFLQRHLGFVSSCEEWDVIEAAFTFLVRAALEQPRAFVHRDFHSRNLLIIDEAKPAIRAPALLDQGIIARGLLSPGIIDFQDALSGPITYDLVSLLRDCYVEWDAARVDGWLEGYRLRLRHAHLIGPEIEAAHFRRWFDLMGLQRHLKVLGIFCRLWYRDGKAQYLGDLALVWRYALSVARRYPELAEFVALLERARCRHDITQPRDEACR